MTVLTTCKFASKVYFYMIYRRVRDASNKQDSYVNSDVQNHSTKLSKSAAAYNHHAEGAYQNAAICEKQTNNRLTSGDFCDIYYSSAAHHEDTAPHVYDVLELDLGPGLGPCVTSPTSLSCVGVDDLAANIYTLADPIP